MSGGTVNVFYMNSEGWTKISREDYSDIHDEKQLNLNK